MAVYIVVGVVLFVVLVAYRIRQHVNLLKDLTDEPCVYCYTWDEHAEQDHIKHSARRNKN